MSQVVIALLGLTVVFFFSLLLGLLPLFFLDLGGLLKCFHLGKLVTLFIVAQVLLHDNVPVLLRDVEGSLRVLISEQLVAVERVRLLHCG